MTASFKPNFCILKEEHLFCKLVKGINLQRIVCERIVLELYILRSAPSSGVRDALI